MPPPPARAGSRRRCRPARACGGRDPGPFRGILGPVTRLPDDAPGLEPERGFVLAVLAPGTDPDEELAEVEELARTAAVHVVGRLTQHRARAPRPPRAPRRDRFQGRERR